MNKAEELKSTTAIVRNILENDPKARNSDSYLISETYKVYGRKYGIDIDHMPVLTFFVKLKDLKLPPPETIRRTRQKLQEKHSELAADPNVQAAREENEVIYKDYAKGVIL